LIGSREGSRSDEHHDGEKANASPLCGPAAHLNLHASRSGMAGDCPGGKTTLPQHAVAMNYFGHDADSDFFLSLA
jgi:hypothetical protein